MKELSLADHSRLVEALMASLTAADGTEAPERIETHISSVILHGDFAYKIKKPLDFGFLDFTTLARRRHFCDEELRLNRRLAPQIYLDVIAITGSVAAPVLGGEGEAIEYAVRMRRFSQDSLLSRLAEARALPACYGRGSGARWRSFTRRPRAQRQTASSATPEAALFPVLENFEQLRPLITAAQAVAQLDRLEQWSGISTPGCATGWQRAARRDGYASATATCTSATWR
jgi:aminoglycoside phosphotransferase family enzyme